jgi:chaperonin GroES
VADELCSPQKQELHPSTHTKNNMANVKIKPIGDRVLVEHVEEKEQVRGGIIIPDSAKEKPQEAKVIALGTGKTGDD